VHATKTLGTKLQQHVLQIGVEEKSAWEKENV